MNIQIRELGKAEIHGFNTAHVSISDNLLWIEEANGLPVFIVEGIRKIVENRNRILI